MSAPTWTLYNSLPALIPLDGIAARGFKLALLDSGYVPNPAHSVWADVSAHEIAAANGYPAGGLADSNPRLVTGQPGGSTQFHIDNVTFQPAPGDLTARYVVLYCVDTIDGQAEPLVGYGLLDGSGVDVVIPAAGQPFVWYWSTLGVAVYATGAVPGPAGPTGPTGPLATLSSATPQPLGVATAGVSADAPHADHVHAMPSAADIGADIAGAAASAQAASQPLATLLSAIAALATTGLLVIGAGGTATTLAAGTANQIVGMNAAGTGLENKSILGTANQVAVNHAAGTVTMSLPQNIHTAATPTFAGLITGKIYPSADSTTALGIYKADGTTVVLGVDTINKRVGIGTAPLGYPLAIAGSVILAEVGSSYLMYDSVGGAFSGMNMSGTNVFSLGQAGYYSASARIYGGMGGIYFGYGDGTPSNNYTGLTLISGVVNVPGTTASTSTTTGALTVAGGLGVAGAGYFGSSVVSGGNVYSATTGGYQVGSNGIFDSSQAVNNPVIMQAKTNTSVSGSIVAVKIAPTYNQASGTAANTDLLINRTQTAVGSGAQLLINAQVGGVSKFSVSNTGALTTAAGFGCNGKSAQTAYSVGAAATDAATTQTLANNLRLMSIANGMAA